jgi:DNA-binding NtrC family response regulator
VLVGEALDWQGELGALLDSQGYATSRVAQLDSVPPMLANGAVQALFLAAGPLAASDLLLLRRIREASPRTAVVVVTKTPTDPDLKRAFESGATAFLSWPASNDAVRRAIHRGTLLDPAASRP